MYKIAIIGAGQLGSRHLQGLAKISIPAKIEVVDKSLESLSVAKERYEQVVNAKNNQSVSFFENIEDLSPNLDLVIIATNSLHRYEILLNLINKKEVKNIVLEKVVFQENDHFVNSISLLENNNINCWVNCTRRLFPFYQSLNKTINDGELISINVQGGNWGLACNSIHFLDLFSFLSQNTNISVNADFLDKKIHQSKRSGYVELTGLLVCEIGRNKMTLFNGEEESNMIISIKTDSQLMIIDESKGKYSIANKVSDWQWECKEEKIVNFQSELTNVLAEDILLRGKCNLTTLKDSYEIHKPFLEAICKHINIINKSNIKACPIT